MGNGSWWAPRRAHASHRTCRLSNAGQINQPTQVAVKDDIPEGPSSGEIPITRSHSRGREQEGGRRGEGHGATPISSRANSSPCSPAPELRYPPELLLKRHFYLEAQRRYPAGPFHSHASRANQANLVWKAGWTFCSAWLMMCHLWSRFVFTGKHHLLLTSKSNSSSDIVQD